MELYIPLVQGEGVDRQAHANALGERDLLPLPRGRLWQEVLDAQVTGRPPQDPLHANGHLLSVRETGSSNQCAV